MKKILIDTNVLLDGFTVEEGNTYIILSHVNRELDKHKTYGNEELKYKTRQAVRFIEENADKFEFDIKDYEVKFDENFDDQYTDNKIVQACLDNGYSLMTNDLLLKQKAKAYDIEIIESKEIVEDDYCGYKIITPTDDELADIYEFPEVNTYNLLVNQYLVIKDKQGNEVDCFRWTGNKYTKLTEVYPNTDLLGKFKCKDIYQKAALDSLQNNSITMIRGKAGSGKSLVALSYILHQLEKGKIDKLVIFSNPFATLGSQGLGFYKGDKNQKLLQSSIGNLLMSKLGDIKQVEAMIEEGVLHLLPFSDIRGYDTGNNSAVWISEAQNLDINLMKLALQRLGEGSFMVVDGDDKTQVDSHIFAGSRNGMKRLSKIFRGEDLYGEIEFTKIYRSRVAEIADKM
mgnify:CR=1 FL=1|jgi:Predicted ATPase related to phosphate starvation-inducible protein PhoH